MEIFFASLPAENQTLKVCVRSHFPEVYSSRVMLEDHATEAGSIITGLQGGKFSSYDPIMIQAQTGFGKSHFILHELLPQVAQKGGRMLLASNRIAVSVQQKLEIMELLDDPRRDWLTPEGIRHETDFGCVSIMTIQGLGSFLRGEGTQEWRQQISVLVVDECHFFTSDALFNPDAEWLLNTLPQYFNRAVRFYLTATPDDVLFPIANVEADIRNRPMEERMKICPSPWACGLPPMLQLFRFQGRGYGHINVRYFHSMDTLMQQIMDTAPERWLIFVSSRAQGGLLQAELGAEAEFLTAENKNTDTWKKFLSTQQLTSRILITTSVLDCGVNIHDDLLRHLVIFTENKTTFLQALGRKRCKPDERVTLYVPAMDTRRLSGLVEQNRKLRQLIEDVETGRNTGHILADLWYQGNFAEREIFHPPYRGQLQPNKLVKHVLRCQAQAYADLSEAIDRYGDSAFPRMVLHWLEQNDAYREENWLEYDAQQDVRSKLRDFLEKYENVPLRTDNEKAEFSQTLVRIHAQITGKPKRNDRSPYLKELALNNALRELGVDYELEVNDNKSWTLRKTTRG